MIKDCPICKERYDSNINHMRVTFAEYMKGCSHTSEVRQEPAALSEAERGSIYAILYIAESVRGENDWESVSKICHAALTGADRERAITGEPVLTDALIDRYAAGIWEHIGGNNTGGAMRKFARNIERFLRAAPITGTVNQQLETLALIEDGERFRKLGAGIVRNYNAGKKLVFENDKQHETLDALRATIDSKAD